ncbi:hypothetical protein ACJX0J_040100, partial [Zea mays]
LCPAHEYTFFFSFFMIICMHREQDIFFLDLIYIVEKLDGHHWYKLIAQYTLHFMNTLDLIIKMTEN